MATQNDTVCVNWTSWLACAIVPLIQISLKTVCTSKANKTSLDLKNCCIVSKLMFGSSCKIGFPVCMAIVTCE